MDSIRVFKNKAGYVLLEALISLAIVAMGILGVAKLHTVIVNSSTEAKARTAAMHLAQEKLEELRNLIVRAEHDTGNCATGNYAAGTLVTSSTSAEAITAESAVFSRTWGVTPQCNPARHDVWVRVGWTDAQGQSQNVTLSSAIAWNDPARSTDELASGVMGGGLVSPAGTARRGDTAKDYDSLPAGAVANGDGTYKYYNPVTKEYELLVRMADGSGYRVVLYSVADLVVSGSGIVALDQDGDSKADIDSFGEIAVEVSDAGYCSFPLNFSNASDDTTYTKTALPSGATAAAYKCYVPQGWYGSIGIYFKAVDNQGNIEFRAFDGSTFVDGNRACPDASNGANIVRGLRSHKVVIKNINGAIIGQSGVLPRHTAEGKLRRLDFVVYEDKSGPPVLDTCTALFADHAVTGTSPASYTISSMGAGGASLSSTCRSDLNCLKPYDYWIEEVIGTVTISGTVSRDPGAATADLSSISLTGDSCTECACTPAAYTSGNTRDYSCVVRNGWTGNITLSGYTPGDVVCPGGSRAYTNVTTTQTGADFAVLPTGTPCP